ncbi:peptidyl-tRNA hydrolase domain-containing protein [Coccidioides immitis H538.4]|uniref:Peptidyl-tRNA hydrolase domain-containing protein n=1 Tax=Coccidioides immitis H538.4 TaxID=396776 RepID=A0A0J8UT53_COCIT|nr:peptidyl-tRNA hydrolase domain-containing protein [Coccidioides immitis H538.4]
MSKQPHRTRPLLHTPLNLGNAGIFRTYMLKRPPGQPPSLCNKTSSAVQLIHLPTNTVVKSQATRSRSQNRKIALQILAEKVELLQKGDESRAAIVAETKRKRKASMTKKSKRKYRALEEKKRREKEEAEISREGEEEGRGEEADELPRR